MPRIDASKVKWVLVIIGPLLLFGPMLLAREVLYWGTPMLQFVPWHRLAIETLRLGEMPLWNPLLGMGAPLLANLQSALLYPPNILLLIFGPEHGHGYLVVLHLVFAGIGMVLLSRRLGIGVFGQLVAGLVYSLSGYMVARAWFISINHTAAWLPWILFSMEGLLEAAEKRASIKQSFAPILGLAFTLAMQWLSGHAQTAWYSLLLLAGWTLWRLRTSFNRATLLWLVSRLLIAGSLAFALAAAQLLPTAEYLSLSQRAGTLDREFALTYSFWPWRLLGFFFPDLFGSPVSGDYWGYGNFWEDAIYIGIFPILLGLGAIGRSLRSAAGDYALEKFLFVLSLITLLLALGKNTPVFPFLFDYVPTFNLFQAPSRWNILLIFSLALLAASGAERWSTPQARGLYWTRLLTAGAGIIAVASFLALQLIPEIEPSFIRSFARSGVLLTFTGLLTLFLPKDKLGLKTSVVGGFILLDLLLAGQGLNPSIAVQVFEGNVLEQIGISSNQRIYMPPSLEEQLKFKQTHRFDSFKTGLDWIKIREVALPNTSMIDGVASINNFDPMVPDRFNQFLSKLETIPQSQQDELLAWAGVSYRINPGPENMLAVVFEPLPQQGRVHLVGETVAAHSAEHALELLVSGAIDLGTQVILESQPAERNAGSGVGHILALDDSRPTSLSISLDMQGQGWLVVADTWYPGWKAYLDGSVVEIHRANYLFRAVSVPIGEHLIEFNYEPLSFRVGSFISVMGLFVSILSGWLCSRSD